MEQRRDVVSRIGLARANDVSGLEVLQEVFNPQVSADLQTVGDAAWIYQEPTFSWLSGFYWHPESTTLPQWGETHSELYFCHLCEYDAYDARGMAAHETCRRHADNFLRWAEQMGTAPLPLRCGRCPALAAAETQTADRRRDLDLEHRRRAGAPEPFPVRETTLPVGFRELYEGFRGRVLATPYVAVEAALDKGVAAVRLLSSWQIGPKEKTHRRSKRWYIELFWCPASEKWRSLAIPLQDRDRKPAAAKSWFDFTLYVQWKKGDNEPWEEHVGPIHVEGPAPGFVAVQPVWHGAGRNSGYCRQEAVLDFVGRGQLQAAGGVEALRGRQLPMQVATEDVMISFMLTVPPEQQPQQQLHPLLLFFHGDMDRGLPNCPQPGLADFVPTYGPALFAEEPKKKWHASRKFVTVTPCCSDEVWWLRYPAVHDSFAYVPSWERCLRTIIDLMYDVGFCDRARRVAFAGQSMGGYMALEMARAMPEATAAVVAAAPCIDACRLDHVASRLVNVPTWLMMGRNDALCSFEECASLALKMRDQDAKLIRLSSVGIKGHSEVGKKLEKNDVFEFMLDPMGSW
eukprot:TRINITY_DN5352_c0_g1_i1.p1 TRINITY_DN5352_c0_g1~~TRINITY_DN5352_c0_g1_i1.p1  ORF type:complete len:629 (-),score=162.72 TRINITY_DN5352_c0_g1_i1:108-1823(-)